MAKYNKPTPEKINTIWATNAVSGDVVEIDTSKIEQGWIQEKPPYQSENWINQQHDQYIAYINQLGIPEWDQYTEYQAGKSYVQASNNLVYRCIQTHVNKNPVTAGNEAFWNIWEGNRQASTSDRGTTVYATDSQTISGTSTNSAVTPASLNARTSTTTRRGLIETATDAEEGAWSSKTLASTPGGIASAFSANSSKNSSGYQELPGGLIIQWGNTEVPDDTATSVTLPKEFPNLIFTVVVGLANSSASPPNAAPRGTWIDNKTLRLFAYGPGVGGVERVRWIAIGH